jgi:hypothetical protein
MQNAQVDAKHIHIYQLYDEASSNIAGVNEVGTSLAAAAAAAACCTEQHALTHPAQPEPNYEA